MRVVVRRLRPGVLGALCSQCEQEAVVAVDLDHYCAEHAGVLVLDWVRVSGVLVLVDGGLR